MAEPVAVAFVVEASITLAMHWKPLVGEYLAPLVKRLGPESRIAFITYALPTTAPSPVLCRRYFLDFAPVTKVIREEPGMLSLGQSNGGGPGGMAALEGLVAALEMFEILGHEGYIFHIALSPPSSTTNPLWNDNPAFDSVTWDSLPGEFKKRGIKYNAILINASLANGQFAELFQRTAGSDATTPWFPVRPGQSVLLHGLDAAKSLKRPADPPAEPNNKRPRLASQPNTSLTSVTPILAPARVPSQNATAAAPPAVIRTPTPVAISLPPAVPNPSPVVAPPPAVNSNPAAITNPFGVNGMPSAHEIVNRFRILEEQVRTGNLELNTAQASGDMQKANALKAELDQKRLAMNKMKMVLMSMKQHALKQQGALGMGGAQPPAAMTNPNPTAILPQQPQQPIQTQPIQPQPQLQPQLQMPMQPQPQIQLQPQPQPPPQPTPRGPVWRGALSWSGNDPNGNKKVVQTFVAGTTMNAVDPLINTWPNTLNLVPWPLPPLSMPDLLAWAKRTGPSLVTFLPVDHDKPTGEANAGHFRNLVTMLDIKAAYAVAQWHLPSKGNQLENVILFFPYNKGSLVGAVFPITGIVEYPKPLGIPGVNPPQPTGLPQLNVQQNQMGQLPQMVGSPPNPNLTSNPNFPGLNALPKPVMEYLSTLPPEQKASALKGMLGKQIPPAIQQQMAQAMMQQQQAQLASQMGQQAQHQMQQLAQQRALQLQMAAAARGASGMQGQMSQMQQGQGQMQHQLQQSQQNLTPNQYMANLAMGGPNIGNNMGSMGGAMGNNMNLGGNLGMVQQNMMNAGLQRMPNASQHNSLAAGIGGSAGGMAGMQGVPFAMMQSFMQRNNSGMGNDGSGGIGG